MKLIIIVLSLTFSIFACDTYEAQFIGEVTRVETDSLTYCKAYLSHESVSHYNVHALCPLDLSEVINEGIDFPLVNGHDCEVNRGEKLSGILVQDNNQIFID